MSLPALKEIIEERKAKAVEELSSSFAKDRLPLEEYERLVEYINKIESERELAVVEKMVAEYGAAGGERETRARGSAGEEDEPYPRHGSSPLPGNLTVLSSRTFTGPVKSGNQYLSILGSGEIRIRKTDLDGAKTVLYVVSVLGDTTVLVEPGIRVVNHCLPILGNAGVERSLEREFRGSDPKLVISGAAILGNITVKPLVR